MPCDSVTIQSVILAKASADILRAGLAADGWKILAASQTEIKANRGAESLTWTAGKGIATVGTAATQSAVAKAYSKAAVTWAAGRAGWTVKAGSQSNKLTLERR